MRLAARLAAAVLLLASVSSIAGDATTKVALDQFAWLAGDWVMDDGKQRVDEIWSTPAPDMLIGMSRTVRAGKTVSFEFLRIVARDDGVFYIAQPRGKPPVEFRLQSFDGREVVFVNPGHADHLARIVYRHNANDTLTARIEGANDGKAFAEGFYYHRAKP